jgi:hypothetical protein
MGWERGRYYTRTVRRNGRVCRVYVGKGPVAERAAAEDARHKAERQSARDAARAERQRQDAAAGPLDLLGVWLDELGRATLLAAGYRQHARSQWRKRRNLPSAAGGLPGAAGTGDGAGGPNTGPEGTDVCPVYRRDPERL